jgi:hypothetical protein
MYHSEFLYDNMIYVYIYVYFHILSGETPHLKGMNRMEKRKTLGGLGLATMTLVYESVLGRKRGIKMVRNGTVAYLN